MNTGNQINNKLKAKKLFDTYNLTGKWRYFDDSLPFHYQALEDGATIELCMIKANFTESLHFKKSSEILIEDSVMEFYEEDLF